MKKNILFLIFAILFSNLAYGQKENKDRALKNGLFINTSMSLNSSNLGMKMTHNYNWEKLSYIDLQFGHRWYIKPQKKWGLGLQTTWFEFTFADFQAIVVDDANFDFYDKFNMKEATREERMATIKLLSLGPVGTFAFTPNLAIDGYYNVLPTFVKANPSGMDEQFGFGFSHVIGFGFRFGVFNIGVDYEFGKIKTLENFISNAVEKIDNTHLKSNVGKINMDLLKLKLGVKF